MNVVETIEELKSNLSLFENYLCDGSEEEQKFACGLIQRGRCFVAYKINGELRFSPSRYIGYANNTMLKHQNNHKDGKLTNPALTQVIGHPLEESNNLESEYLAFAKRLAINPDSHKQKYWTLAIEGDDFIENISSNESFPEGKMVERSHKKRERSSKLISMAKERFLQQHGKLVCMICNFDFEKVYGERGEGYIEAHHTVPVSEMKVGQNTRIEDIALVCSNCHRILHRSRPWLKMKEIKALLKNKNKRAAG